MVHTIKNVENFCSNTALGGNILLEVPSFSENVKADRPWPLKILICLLAESTDLFFLTSSPKQLYVTLDSFHSRGSYISVVDEMIPDNSLYISLKGCC